MEFGILGPLEGTDGGEPMSVAGTKVRALFALLLVDVGSVVLAGRLADQLYGDDLPANVAHALQTRVSQLRRTLGAHVVVGRPPGYVLPSNPRRWTPCASSGSPTRVARPWPTGRPRRRATCWRPPSAFGAAPPMPTSTSRRREPSPAASKNCASPPSRTASAPTWPWVATTPSWPCSRRWSPSTPCGRRCGRS